MKTLFTLAALAVALLGGCGRTAEEETGPSYSQGPAQAEGRILHLAIHPLHNPRKLSEAYQPLIDHLNARLKGVHIELEASRDYQAYEEKFRARQPELLLPNPWQTLHMAGDAEDFKGIFIVRKDSGIETPADLKGKAVSYPSPTALAAAIMPQYYLHSHGIDVNKDIQNLYVGSQESSIMNAYLKSSAAAATWLLPWRLFQKDHPAEAAQLRLIWETPPLLNNSVMLRDDVSPELGRQIQTIIEGLDKTPEGRAILAGMETARFHHADDASYAPVREYIERFEREVRPVEAK